MLALFPQWSHPNGGTRHGRVLKIIYSTFKWIDELVAKEKMVKLNIHFSVD